MQLVNDGRLAKWIGKATIFRSPIRLRQWRFAAEPCHDVVTLMVLERLG